MDENVFGFGAENVFGFGALNFGFGAPKLGLGAAGALGGAPYRLPLAKIKKYIKMGKGRERSWN